MTPITVALLLTLVMGMLPAADPVGRTLAQTVEDYLVETDYPTFLLTIEKWKKLPHTDRVGIVELLVRRIGDTKKIGVSNPADLFIPYRVSTRELKTYGHGHIVTQDLFIVGGKAVWAIEQLIGTDLPEINEGQLQEDRAKRVEEITRSIAAYKQVLAYLSDPDFPTLEKMVKQWKALPIAERVRVLDFLVPHLSSTDKPGLKNYEDARIPYRVTTGHMPEFHRGKRLVQIEQDLFMASARSAWGIEELVGVRLPALNDGQSGEERGRHIETIKRCLSVYKAGVRHGSAEAPKK